MIISASRRTDIPAFYSDWLLNRLKAEYVDVRNPMNAKQISRVMLKPEVVDCIVFWTKNALPMLDKLDAIDAMGYAYYFLWTITPYDDKLEPHVPDVKTVINGFKTLSEQIGSQRMVWRYDPVILSGQYPLTYHVREFEKMCEWLAGYTQTCIFSFLDLYAKIKNTLQRIVDAEDIAAEAVLLAENFAAIAKKYNITLETCAEEFELGQWGIQHAACINLPLIEKITGYSLKAKPDSGQRPACQCIESVDIGAYDTCLHGCVYCYATASSKNAAKNKGNHDPCATLLCGQIHPGDKVTLRSMQSLKVRQISLL